MVLSWYKVLKINVLPRCRLNLQASRLNRIWDNKMIKGNLNLIKILWCTCHHIHFSTRRHISRIFTSCSATLYFPVKIYVYSYLFKTFSLNFARENFLFKKGYLIIWFTRGLVDLYCCAIQYQSILQSKVITRQTNNGEK